MFANILFWSTDCIYPHFYGCKISKKILNMQIQTIFFYFFIKKLYLCTRFELTFMKNYIFLTLFVACTCVACTGPSPAEQHRLEKHQRDSIALVDQIKSLTYYQSMLDSLSPKADSILPSFKYEKNERYQDHGYYVLSNGRIRVLVRDDGQIPVTVYYDGVRIENNDKRLSEKDQKLITQATELYVIMADIYELERRIKRTSLEIQKYQKRLQK